MPAYKYFVTFNSKNEDDNPGVSIYKNENERVHHLPGLHYPHHTNRGAAIYKGDKYVIRAVTPKANLFEIDPFCQGGGEKYLKDTWGNCKGVASYRDCTVLVNRHIFLVNPEDIQLKTNAGGDWEHNVGAIVIENFKAGENLEPEDYLYVVSSQDRLWRIKLEGWSVGCEVKEIKLNRTIDHIGFVAVDPTDGHVYIGGQYLYKWDGKINNPNTDTVDISIHKTIETKDAFAGGITVSSDGTRTLWYVNGNHHVHKVDVTKLDEYPKYTGLKSNGLGFV